MRKRRYSYSYSPSSRRERSQPRKGPRLSGWLLLPAVVLLAAAAVLLQQAFAGSGSGSAASRSDCWTRVACSSDRVQLNDDPPASKDGPAAARAEDPADWNEEAEAPPDELVASDAAGEDDDAGPPLILAAAAAVIEGPCDALVHSVNAHARLSPASLTKIVTALVAAEQADIAQTVKVTIDGGALSAATNATVMGLQPGQQLSMVDLLYGMLLPSGNDAAIEIAEQVGGSVEAFAGMMNARVQAMGLEDSQFMNPTGLDEPGHYTSAYDIAMLGAELLRNPDLAFIVGTRSYQPAWNGPRITNLNLLLGQYPGALGVKTGYTEQARHTFVAAAERDGRRFVVSVLGSEDIYADATALLDWAFASAPSVCASPNGNQVAARS